MKPKTLIDALGGCTQLSKKIGISKQAISEWQKRDIPRAWKMYFKLQYPELFRRGRK